MILSGLLVLGLLAFGLIGGWLYVGVKSPKATVLLRQGICDDRMVERYNEVLGQPSPKHEEQLGQLVDEVKARSGHEQDATCVWILLQGALQKKEFAAADSAIATLKQLRQSGYSNPALKDLRSVEAAESMVKLQQDIEKERQAHGDAPEQLGE